MNEPCDLCLIVDHVAFRCVCPCHDDRSRGEHSRTSPDGSVTVTVPCDELVGELEK